MTRGKLVQLTRKAIRTGVPNQQQPDLVLKTRKTNEWTYEDITYTPICTHGAEGAVSSFTSFCLSEGPVQLSPQILGNFDHWTIKNTLTYCMTAW